MCFGQESLPACYVCGLTYITEATQWMGMGELDEYSINSLHNERETEYKMLRKYVGKERLMPHKTKCCQ